MSYRSKTYTGNDVIFVKRSMIRVFFKVFLVDLFLTTALESARIVGGIRLV